MTKKHFERFAAMVQKLDLSHADKAHVALMLANELEALNPRFDRSRFLAACGFSGGVN